MIIVENIRKSYANVVALPDISFTVAAGEIFGLIGPDGAGKTSLFRILTSLLLPDSGTATVYGYDTVKDYKALRKIIGYMPGKFSLYQDLTIEENLDFFAGIFNTTRAENYHLIEDIYVQLAPFKNRRAGKLSGGMKQKLALCCALIHKPKVLFLDEPTTGVDPVSRKEFWDMLGQLGKQGITILVSTPYMDEASRCHRVALMQKGKILSLDTPAGIIEQYHKRIWSIQSQNMFQLLHDLRDYPIESQCFAFGEVHHFSTDNPDFNPQMLLPYLSDKGHQALKISPITPNIEDCFMALMQMET